MTEDLPRIQHMGFNNVWVNPLFEPCQSMEWSEREIARGLDPVGASGESKNLRSKPGSPYATRSFAINKQFSNHKNEPIGEAERQEKDYDDIHAYTQKAASLGMTPMCDFIMRHVAVDNPLVKQKPHWFRHHPNGNFVFFGRNDKYHVVGQSWDDVLEFNYSDPKIRREIMEEYLKPMADLVVGRLGFQGLRIDAAGQIPREVYEEIIPYMDQICQQHHGKPPVMLGETLGQNVDEFMHTGGYMDYVYNSVFFQPFTRDAWDVDDTDFSAAKGKLQKHVAPTVGFPGNHDTARLADYYLNQFHVRGDLLRQVIIAESIDGNIPPQSVIKTFISLNEKNAFSQDDLKELVKKLEKCGAVDAATAEQLGHYIDEKGKLNQQQIKKWFNDHPVIAKEGAEATEEGKQAFKIMTNLMFKLVAEEKEKEKNDPRYGDQRNKKLITEDAFIRMLPGKLDPTRLKRLVKEGFCFAAFASDGGWFMTRGEEMGATKRINVFNATPSDLDQRAYPDLDFSGFVGSINRTVAQLPPMSEPEWVQRCYFETNKKNKALAAFLLHQGEGFSNPSHMVIANVSEEQQVMDFETFKEINSANGRNIDGVKIALPTKVYLCGDVKLTQHLRMALEQKHIKIVESERPPLVEKTAKPITLDDGLMNNPLPMPKATWQAEVSHDPSSDPGGPRPYRRGAA